MHSPSSRLQRSHNSKQCTDLNASRSKCIEHLYYQLYIHFSSLRIFPLQDYNEQCPYSLSPVSIKSQKLLRSPRKATRKISKIPFKVLDAPELQDDFYLNLVDWSAQNVLAVGLGSCVYLWSACTSQVS